MRIKNQESRNDSWLTLRAIVASASRHPFRLERRAHDQPRERLRSGARASELRRASPLQGDDAAGHAWLYFPARRRGLTGHADLRAARLATAGGRRPARAARRAGRTRPAVLSP